MTTTNNKVTITLLNFIHSNPLTLDISQLNSQNNNDYDLQTNGLTNICQPDEFVLCIPYDTATATGATTDGLEHHKLLLLCGWFVVALVFAVTRRAFGDRNAADWLLVDSIARSLSVGVPTTTTDCQQPQTAASSSLLRGALNMFAMLFATFVSGALFDELLQPVRGRRTIRSLAELVAVTTLPVQALDFNGVRRLTNM